MFELVTMCKDCNECEATGLWFAGPLCDYCKQKRTVAEISWELAQYAPTDDVRTIAALTRALERNEAKLASMTPNRIGNV